SGWTISELIEAAKHSKWEKFLLDGWSQATLSCQDLEWASALLDETASKETTQSTMQSLFQILPQARQEAFIIKLLKADPDLNTSHKPAYTCISCCQGQWSEALTRVVIDSLVHSARKQPKYYHHMTFILGYKIPSHLNPALIPEAVIRLTEATTSLTELQTELEPFLNFIQFRHEMLKEF
ncbi:MAG TPA: hypothetical protein VFY40_07205, partial [Blastocatellia bacterium]|nr:hypothetical protein [Blastocatellia bacterium]